MLILAGTMSVTRSIVYASPPHSGNGHVQGLRDLTERSPLVSQCIDLFSIDLCSWASDSFAERSGMCDPCPHSFGNQVSLKLCNRTHDVTQQLASGCRGID